MKRTLKLDSAGILTILAALNEHEDLWHGTVAYLNGEYVDGTVANCDDISEAKRKLKHYSQLIRSIEQQSCLSVTNVVQ